MYIHTRYYHDDAADARIATAMAIVNSLASTTAVQNTRVRVLC
jgi:hypothetical protein